MRYYDTLATYERNGFTVIVDKTWEDLPLSHCFDESVTDLKQLAQDIDSGKYEHFMLRVRCLVDGHELGSAYLGSMLYEDARECLTDGSADDLIWEALQEAKTQIWPLMRRLQAINEEMERHLAAGQ